MGRREVVRWFTTRRPSAGVVTAGADNQGAGNSHQAGGSKSGDIIANRQNGAIALKNSKPKKPKPPKSLSAEAARWWQKLVDEYAIDDEAGRLILQTAMEAYDRTRQTRKALAKDGLVLKDRFGQPKAHPLVTVERDSRAAMMAALRQLNLDIEPLRDRPGRPEGA